MRKKYFIISGIILLILILLLIGFKNRKIDIHKLTDEQIIELIKSDKIKNLSSEQLAFIGERLRNIPKGKIKDVIDKLPDGLKYKAEKNIEKVSCAVLDKKIDEFFKSPPEKQEQILDEEINKLEEAQLIGETPIEYSEIFEENISSPDETNYRFERRVFSQRSFRRGFSRNPDAMLQRARDRLSETTPEQRAKRQEFMKKMRERMAKRYRR